jgi:pyruvate dehydrogenase E2 component (dihydrolipoamide acetyltransferase)
LSQGGALMATEFFIPKLGQTVEEVTLVAWLVPDGAQVKQGQEIMEVETDKAIFPVEATGKGTLHIGPYKAGEVVAVLTVVAFIGKPEDTFESLTSSNPLSKAMPAEADQVTLAAAIQPNVVVGEGGKLFASPRARKLAGEKGANLAEISPSGGGGVRVIEKDVIAYLEKQPTQKQAVKATPLAERIASAEGVDLSILTGTGTGGKVTKEDVQRSLQPAVVQAVSTPDAEVVDRIPLKGVRGIIAERMAASVHTAASVTLTSEVDATEFVAMRERLKAKVEKDWGFAPGYNDLLGKICAAALRKYPRMNARLAGDVIEILGHVNIGMAVDTERGLLVPVVKDADRKNLHEFGEALRSLVERARKGRSLPDDLSGGTFTITNLGMYEIDAFTPVINLPEVAILGVGRIAPKPVVRNGAVEIRQMMVLSLVFDHRLVDGAPAARFLQEIKYMVEEPYLMLTV